MSDYCRGSSVTKMLNSLKWKPVAIQHKKLRPLMFYKIVNKIVELSLPDYIIPAPRVTRENSTKFVHPVMHIDSYKYSFFPSSITYWNKLPSDVANTIGLSNFKNMLQSIL